MRPSDSPFPSKVIFYSIHAQPDNLGDIEIRQTLLDWLKQSDNDLMIYAGKMPTEYVNAFQLPANSRLFRSSLEFQRELLRHAAKRRAHIAFAPGPQWFGRRGNASRLSLTHLGKPLLNLGNILLIRVSGGKAVGLGRAVRGSGRFSQRIERARVRSLNLFTSRDDATSAALEMEVRSEPDLAFSNLEISSDAGSKPYLAISLRSDVARVNRSAIKSLIHSATAIGLQPILVTQVRSDDAEHHLIARMTGIPLISWDERTHAVQMQRVKQIYRTSQFVVSDRLHALIFGLQTGACAIAIVHPGNDKLTSTLRPFVPLTEVRSQDESWSPILDKVLQDSRYPIATSEAVISAKDRLENLRKSVVALLSGTSGSATQSTRPGCA